MYILANKEYIEKKFISEVPKDKKADTTKKNKNNKGGKKK